MARILSRPMFRKGGLSKAPRPSYRGGGVTAIRPGYRGGGMNGIMSGIVPRTNAYAGYYNQETRLPSSVPISSLEEAYTPGGFEWWDWAKTKPKIITTPGGKTINVAGAREIETTPPDFVKMPLPTEGKSKPEVKTGDKTIPDINTPVVSDEEAMESYMKMFEKAAGTDPDETKRSKWLELAKFGANVLGQPGGDLAGAIGKAAAPSIEGLGKTMAEDRAAKRQLRIAGLQAYLKGNDPGTIGNAVKDIMAANKNLSKQEALTLALRSGTATRESTAEDRTQKIQDTLYKSGFVKNEVYARDAALALQESVEQGVPSTRYTKLPEDPGDRKDGAYYIDPDSGILGRYNKSTKEIIEPGDPGFKPKKK